MTDFQGKSPQLRNRIARRDFLKRALRTYATLALVPRDILGGRPYVAPSDKLTAACIGVGAQGTRVMMNFLQQPDVQIVAVCDVNQESSDYSEWGKNELRDKERRLLGSTYSNWGGDWAGCTAGREPARRLVEAYYGLKKSSGRYRGCAAYRDFRELLENDKDLDAVIVCTPDHWHAPVAIAAMMKGKHVYGQKPMTHSIAEARRMAEVARQTRVATQVAITNQASESTRLLCEWIWAGAIGPVRHVMNWSTRPFWPQGINRPEKADPVPEGLDWDLWLGPRPFRPFSHAYLPFVWRGWYDFGTGAVGDMGCYSFDTIFRVLKLGPPESVEASSTEVLKETFPVASIIHFNFPARGEMPPVRVSWYDGGLRPASPDELEESLKGGEENEGLLFVGDGGKILCGFSGENPRLIPESTMRAFQPPPKTLPRSAGHDREWIEASKGGQPAGANFEFESLVTESLLLGNVALRAGKRLRWDGTDLKVTNDAGANAFVSDTYRAPWTV